MKKVQRLNSGWKVRKLESHGRLQPQDVSRLSMDTSSGLEDWIPTDMPAEIHDVLLTAGLIENPAMKGSFGETTWVSECDWVYRNTFVSHKDARRFFLHFKGLDTLVDVYLNEEHIAFHNNIYLPLRVDVTGKLGDTNNLLLHFHSPQQFIRDNPLPPEWEGKFAANRLLRKPNPEFGSFLGAAPPFVKVGIYGDVILESVDEMEIEHVDVSTQLSESFGSATIQITVDGDGFVEAAKLRVEIASPAGSVLVQEEVTPEHQAQGWQGVCELRIDDPELWWPRGYGGQPLYEVTTSLISGKACIDSDRKSIGIRKVEMPNLFDFRINGKRVRLWGANLVPFDGFTHCPDSERLDEILDLVENANMNSLRAWGPGAPLNEQLFDEADRRGLLLWVDFFHDIGMYPDTQDFRAIYTREAEHHVRTLKHHPSILMWCGGNENHYGAECLAPPGAEFLGRQVFESDYVGVCRRLDPDRYYHVNSPYSPVYANEPLQGDFHDWKNIFRIPGEDCPLFFDELARSSIPSVKSMRRLVDPDEFWPTGFTGAVRGPSDSPLPASWKRLDLGPPFGRWSTFQYSGPVGEFYDTGETPEGLVYRLGAAHSRYFRDCVEWSRRSGPSADTDNGVRSAGVMVWKLSDAWPQIGTSMIDYFLEPKMVYYALRRAYEPILLSFEIGRALRLWLVNDTGREVTGTLALQLFDMSKNEVFKSVTDQVTVEGGQSSVVVDLDEFGPIPRGCVLHAILGDDDGQPISRAYDFLDVERHLLFPDARISLTATDGVLTLTTDKFARSIELSGNDDGDEFGWFFEDNYFDLMPGEVKHVRLLGRHRNGTVTAKPFYSESAAELEIGH
ncbi:MAG: hypothetical protein HN919_06640 [Verrucomicrobia bacterium]|nr:hypothetical protein [Verrucomicrobiota bacterium]